MKTLYLRPYFFDDGIHFECARCGACCTGTPGVICVDEDEIQAISKFLDLDAEDFKRQQLYPWKEGFSIKEHPDGRCIYFDKGCRIYPVRPMQCRTFPFWLQNLRSEEKWHKIEKECPGIGKGRLYEKEEILDILKQTL